MRKQIDARTKTMSAEALTCRAWKHAMVPIPTPADVRLAYKQRGQRLVKLRCLRGCTRWRDVIIDLATDEVVGGTGGYGEPDTYLVQAHGTGRLPRTAAMGAYFRVVGDAK